MCSTNTNQRIWNCENFPNGIQILFIFLEEPKSFPEFSLVHVSVSQVVNEIPKIYKARH